MKLHEISTDIKSILDSDDQELINDNLDSMELAFNEKAESLVKYTQNIEADIKQVDDMIKQLQARKKTMKNKVDSFREYIRHNMEANGFNKIECPLFTMTLKKAPAVLDVIDESLIPDEFVDVEVVEKINSTKLKNALKAGEVEGARLVEGKRALMIKI